jgi:hypothetical protein
VAALDLSQIENGPTGALERFQTLIERRRLSVQLIKARTQLAGFREDARVVGKHMADSVEGITARGVKPGFAYEVIGDFEVASHNAAYVTRPMEP